MQNHARWNSNLVRGAFALFLCAGSGGIGAGVALAQSTVNPQAAPAAMNPAAQPAASAAEPKDADELLRALESADKSITTLSSTLRYTKIANELVGGDDEVREGNLWFHSRSAVKDGEKVSGDQAAADAPDRRFQVEFTTLTLGKTRRADRRIWIFDGRWLVEKDFETRFVHRREVVRPGEKIDPLAIGQGPLPIPIGQKREKILERFEATLVAYSDGFEKDGAPPSLAETYQLHLKPKPGATEARDFREVRIWYRKGDLLPRLARALHKDGSTTEVLLPGIEVNKDLPEGVFDARTPEGWNEQIDDFRKAIADE